MEPTTTNHQGTVRSEDVQAIQAAPVPIPGLLEAVSPSPGPGNRDDRGGDAPAPPPVWTRYIDSRLKQFCTR